MTEGEFTGLPPGLIAGYLESARAQLDTLTGLADQLGQAPTDRAVLDAVRREAHRIRGSAGSFGFPDATTIAATLEETLKAWLAVGPPPDAAAQVSRTVGALRNALRAPGA